jgi:antitoxin ParD1/3/4
MSAERVTVSLPADVLREAKGRVAAGEAESLSAYVAGALRTTMSRTRALAELERVGRRPPAGALAAVRRDLGLGPAADRAAGRATG